MTPPESGSPVVHSAAIDDASVRALMMMAVRYLALLALLALQGCITRALWQKDDVTPELQTVSVPCDVLDVTTSADAGDSSILVRFSPAAAPGTPPQPTQFYSGRTGLVELEPHVADMDWRRFPGAELFPPSSWDFRVTSGTYFRDPPANAELVFHGVVCPDDLGQVIRPDRIPEPLRQSGDGLLDQPASLLESRYLAAFLKHPWMELLLPTSGKTAYRSTPLAWVDDDLNPIPTIEPPAWQLPGGEEAPVSLLDLSLLARLEDDYGAEYYVLIPLPVLFQGTDLSLHRQGDAVHWSRSQIWTARLAPEVADSEGWVPFDIPLREQAFDFRWSREVGQSELALDILRVLATPVTAALDFAIMTNEALSRLAEYLAGEGKPGVPVQKSGR